MAPWLQILLGILAGVTSVISIILSMAIMKNNKNNSTLEEKLRLENRLTKLEASAQKLEDYMWEVLSRNINGKP